MQYQTGSREQRGLGILLVPVLTVVSEAGPCAGTDVVFTHTVGAPTPCPRVSGQSGHNKIFSPTHPPPKPWSPCAHCLSLGNQIEVLVARTRNEQGSLVLLLSLTVLNFYLLCVCVLFSPALVTVCLWPSTPSR